MLLVPSPKSHSVDVMGPWEELLNSTIRGALSVSTFTEKDAEGGKGVGAGIVGVDIGATVEVGTTLVASAGTTVAAAAGTVDGADAGPPQAIARTAKKIKPLER